MKERFENFGFVRGAGILLPVSSLPSKYGIGNFGKCAFDFIDFLHATGQRCWQVLPLNPTSYGDSPYQSPSSTAGNPYFICPEILYFDGLITKDELKSAENNSERVDYGWLFNTRYALLRLAHSRFKGSEQYLDFVKKNRAWLEDYALFMALKTSHGYAEWVSWEDEYKNVNKARRHASEFEEEMSFFRFLQYEFFKQWQAILDYAHERGILIIGDIPIYVAHDSMDVWRAPDEFLLDDNYYPVVVAGVPPDDFAPDGQLWGNPIYNWERMELDGFSWWCSRLKSSFGMYDILRIDHFRGFAGYYSIPYGDETAKRGEWSIAPGEKLFKRVREVFPDAKIIAEDLGVITPDVRELLQKTGFPGMKLLQFAFYDEDNEYLPRTYTTKNCVAYTGSHDSDCTKSWYRSLNPCARKRFKKECPRRGGESATVSLIRLVQESSANLVIIPMQDYLELTNEAGRMNTPATSEGNWTYKLRRRYRTKALTEKILRLTKEAGRINR